jgi:hypothetical protein
LAIEHVLHATCETGWSTSCSIGKRAESNGKVTCDSANCNPVTRKRLVTEVMDHGLSKPLIRAILISVESELAAEKTYHSGLRQSQLRLSAEVPEDSRTSQEKNFGTLSIYGEPALVCATFEPRIVSVE